MCEAFSVEPCGQLIVQLHTLSHNKHNGLTQRAPNKRYPFASGTIKIKESSGEVSIVLRHQSIHERNSTLPV
jgi:hypothetical protein